MDNAYTQVIVSLISVLLGAAVGAALKDRPRVASIGVGLLMLTAGVLVYFNSPLKYQYHSWYTTFAVGDIAAGYACSIDADVSVPQCRGGERHCYSAPGADSDTGYCIAGGNDGRPFQHCAFPGTDGVRWGTKVRWSGILYDCLQEGEGKWTVSPLQ